MKKFKILFILGFIILINFKSYSQTGGNNTYEFLNLTSSSRVAALGGNFLSVYDHDITLAVSNPSLITEGMSNHLALSFVDYYDDINYGFAAYSKTFPSIGSWAASIQFIDYGKFKRADYAGNLNGEFSANELAFNVGWGRSLDSNFSIGANLKAISSSLESYNSFGLAVDVAGTYNNPENNFTTSLIFRNIGAQIVSYYSGGTGPLPFEIQLGLSKRLQHVPFRYSILLTNLQKWDLTYSAPDLETSGVFQENSRDKTGVADFADKLMRHIVVGGELYIGKNFTVRLGYNYKRRQEMKVESRVSTIGFSWGFGIKISRFHFNFSRSTYHLVGSPNYITITTNLSELFSKK